MNHTPVRADSGISGSDRTRPKPKLVDARRLEALMVTAARASARELIAEATETVVDLLGERGSCVLLDGGPRVVLATHARLSNLPVDIARYPEMRAALDTEGVVAVEDVRTDPLMEPVRELLPANLASVAVIPLMVGEHRLGVLMVQSSSQRAMTPEALATAGLVGRLTALVLETRLGKRIDLVFTGTYDSMPAVGAGATPQPVAAGEARTSGRRRVLVVDDDPEHAGALAVALRHGGYDVDVAVDGAEGLRRAQESAPDVILLEVCLPILDGIMAAERLRQDPRTRSVPIMFLSAFDDLLPRTPRDTFDHVEFLPPRPALLDLLARVSRSMRT